MIIITIIFIIIIIIIIINITILPGQTYILRQNTNKYSGSKSIETTLAKLDC